MLRGALLAVSGRARRLVNTETNCDGEIWTTHEFAQDRVIKRMLVAAGAKKTGGGECNIV